MYSVYIEWHDKFRQLGKRKLPKNLPLGGAQNYSCSWVSLRHFAVNLGGVNLNSIDVYAVMDSANDMKLHVFDTKHKANTYYEHLIRSDDCASI